jgi:ribosome biogenesis GTPase
MQAKLEKGLAVRTTGSEVWVETGVEGRIVPCVLRGRFRLKDRDFRVVAGDRLLVRPPDHEGAAWTIEDVEPRVTWLSRFVERDGIERVIVANVDRLYVVVTLQSPPVHYEFVDRVLVSAERGRVGAVVVLNKIDLYDRVGVDKFAALYSSCGYRVLCTCALTGEGVDRLSAGLGSGIYAFVGESGVGKSSLLMSVDPGLDLKVRAIGDKTGRGRHTTTFSQLYKLKGSGYLADTPGMQTFGFPGTDKTQLSDCFPEFEQHASSCRFRPCTHSHEPDCGVKRAAEEGAVRPTRYQSYIHILAEVEARGRRFSG